MLVGMWTRDHMCFSTVVNLNSGLNGVQIYNVRGAQEVEDQHSNHQ